ncbi:MAG: Arm DNA-binding domain-containing protein [Bradyrhizobium sp.]|uniref:Arm DNA-binding domain-containing protein n=1 Tax=Bradyrhizobium sp. TaxID=376 RepID=UPI003BD1692F
MTNQITMHQDSSRLCFPRASQPIFEVLPMPALQSAEIVKIPQQFSDVFVRRLKLGAGEKDRIHWDPEMPGFGVRVRSSKTVYVVQYRFQKATQRESLGDVRKLKVDEARKVARQFFAKLELGVDPREERRKADQASEVARLTLKTVSELYLTAKETRMRPSTYKAQGLLRSEVGASPSQADWFDRSQGSR